MCLTVQVVWQVKRCGCGSCFKMKEWVNLVWPIRNRDITTCSLLDFLDAGLHSPKVGWIWKSLLWMLLLLLLLFCVKEFINCWFSSQFRGSWIYRVSDLRPIWLLSLLFHSLSLQCGLGVQHIIISFLFDIESNLFNSLMIRGIWNFLFLNDSKTESESENIINFLCLLFEMMLRARSLRWRWELGHGLLLGR